MSPLFMILTWIVLMRSLGEIQELIFPIGLIMVSMRQVGVSIVNVKYKCDKLMLVLCDQCTRECLEVWVHEMDQL